MIRSIRYGLIIILVAVLAVPLANVVLAAVDDSYTVVLLHANGTNNSQSFYDEAGKTWTANGDVKIDTSTSIFGGASAYFDGTGDYLSTPNHSDFDLGTGDWTIDFWIVKAYAAGTHGIISTEDNTNAGWGIGITSNTIFLEGSASGAYDTDIQYSLMGPPGFWTHIALVRYGTALTVYINGAAVVTEDVTGYNYNSSGTGAVIGRLYTNGNGEYLTSHMDEIRISKGVARWTGDFTSPQNQYGTEDTPTYTPTTTPTNTATFTPTYTPTNTVTVSSTYTPTSTFTLTLTTTPSITNTPTDTKTPTITRTPIPPMVLTSTYDAAYVYYSEVAQEIHPTIIMVAAICGVVLLILVILFIWFITKRR
jgi:hypothetical protein